MDALYQQQLLALAKTARASLPLSDFTHTATVTNPTCGDRVELRLNISADNHIADASVSVRGCALCEAGAGLLLGTLTTQTSTSLQALRDGVATWLGGDADTPSDGTPQDLKIFMPVREIRNRHKCVLLSFEAAAKATA